MTFILVGDRLATVRYDEPRAFSLFQTRATKPGCAVTSGRDVLIGLLDAVTDRLADVLERVGLDPHRPPQRGEWQALIHPDDLARDLRLVVDSFT
ncbi:hypothetical protein J8J40_25880, partial [Mycobacterium tuberculosis]|nr:hypothetical protein [Mycobacterium tuberculosis]